jgi:DNA-binding NarL/FixJ family response regulator
VRTFTSAIEGVLAVARQRPEAVVVNLDDVEGREADLVRALGRARPGVRICLVVSAHAEPLARQLVRSGAAGYLIATGGLHRLPQMLSPTLPSDAGGAGPAPGPP